MPVGRLYSFTKWNISCGMPTLRLQPPVVVVLWVVVGNKPSITHVCSTDSLCSFIMLSEWNFSTLVIFRLCCSIKCIPTYTCSFASICLRTLRWTLWYLGRRMSSLCRPQNHSSSQLFLGKLSCSRRKLCHHWPPRRYLNGCVSDGVRRLMANEKLANALVIITCLLANVWLLPVSQIIACNKFKRCLSQTLARHESVGVVPDITFPQ